MSSTDRVTHVPRKVIASGQVKTGPGKLFTVTLTAGADAATLILYDNTSGSGTELCNIKCPAGDSRHFDFGGGIDFSIGINAAITGTGPVAIVVSSP